MYGRKKSDVGPLGWMGCSRRHYINSFFTYGGADRVLRAIGETPEIYYDSSVEYTAYDDAVQQGDDAVQEDDANNRRRLEDANGDDDGNSYEYPSNSNCVKMEGDGYGGYYETEQDDRRLSGSGSGDQNNGYSSTLGCDANGEYIMGIFKGNSCDGNYFTEVIDTIPKYNKQHNRIGCHALYKTNDGYNSIKYTRLVELLSNSWTCDVSLYPNSCPDPYGVKSRFEYAMKQAAEHGSNPMWTLRNSQWRRPLRTASWIMIIAALMVLYATYNIKNAKRIKARGGGWKNGLKCLSEDIKNLPMAFMVWRKSYMMKELGERRADRQEAQAARRGRSSPSTDDKTRSRSKSSRRSKSRSKKSKISKGSEKDAAASGTAVDTLDEHF